MKLIHAGYIAIVFALLLVGFCPAHSSTWEPTVEWVIEIEGCTVPWRVYQESEHFRWQVRPGRMNYPERIYEAERLLHSAIRENRTTEPVETPEPGTLLLLASGLGILAWRKKPWLIG